MFYYTIYNFHKKNKTNILKKSNMHRDAFMTEQIIGQYEMELDMDFY